MRWFLSGLVCCLVGGYVFVTADSFSHLAVLFMAAGAGAIAGAVSGEH